MCAAFHVLGRLIVAKAAGGLAAGVFAPLLLLVMLAHHKLLLFPVGLVQAAFFRTLTPLLFGVVARMKVPVLAWFFRSLDDL